MPEMEIQITTVHDETGKPISVLGMTGSLDSNTFHQFEQAVNDILASGIRDVIIDFQNVEYINSTGLGVLLKYSEQIEKISGSFRLARVSDKNMFLFELLGFEKLFCFLDTLTDPIPISPDGSVNDSRPTRSR